MNELEAKKPNEISPEERALLNGDLRALSQDQRTSLYVKVCTSLGLNPLTQPFSYIELNGKLQMYASRNCTDQLRQIHNVSLKITSRERVGEIYVVTAQASTPQGRVDESTGAVTIGHLKGDNLANGLMKAETKAKRRVTLSICGLSMLDETELETIRDVKLLGANPDARLNAPGSDLRSGSEENESRHAPDFSSEPWPNGDSAEHHESSLEDLGEYIIPFGKTMKGKRLKDIHHDSLRKSVAWVRNEANKPLSRSLSDFLEHAEAYLKHGGHSW